MVVLSKEFVESNLSKTLQCQYLHKYAKGCIKNTLLSLLGNYKSCAKFYFAIYLFQLLFKTKKLKIKGVIRILKMYAISMTYGALFFVGFQAPLCLYSNLFGNINLTIIKLALFFTSFTIFVELRTNREMNTIIWFNMLLDMLITKYEVLGYYTRTPAKETTAFMLLSGILMYLLSTNKLNFIAFWFHRIQCIEDPPETQCNHPKKCTHYIRQGFINFFMVGYAWNIGKTLLAKLLLVVRKPSKIPGVLFNRDNIDFGLLLGLYVTIYRFSTCTLMKLDKKRKSIHSLIGGTFAGIAYYLKPNSQFLITPFITILQILYRNYTEDFDDIKKRLPLLEMFFILCSYFVAINYFFGDGIVSRYAYSVFHSFTNGVASNIKSNIWKSMGVEIKKW